jgi:hypothetical protein
MQHLDGNIDDPSSPSSSHTCKYCEDLLLDFSDRDPVLVLQPLHKLMEKWPSDWFKDIPSWILPKNPAWDVPKPGQSRTQSFKKRIRTLLKSKSKPVDRSNPQAVAKDQSFEEKRHNPILNYVFFDLSLSQFLERTERGCLFFDALKNGILVEWRKINDDGRFILAAENMVDGVTFGIPQFDYRRFAAGVNLVPLMTFKWMAPKGQYLV